MGSACFVGWNGLPLLGSVLLLTHLSPKRIKCQTEYSLPPLPGTSKMPSAGSDCWHSKSIRSQHLTNSICWNPPIEGRTNFVLSFRSDSRCSLRVGDKLFDPTVVNLNIGAQLAEEFHYDARPCFYPCNRFFFFGTKFVDTFFRRSRKGNRSTATVVMSKKSKVLKRRQTSVTAKMNISCCSPLPPWPRIPTQWLAGYSPNSHLGYFASS